MIQNVLSFSSFLQLDSSKNTAAYKNNFFKLSFKTPQILYRFSYYCAGVKRNERS